MGDTSFRKNVPEPLVSGQKLPIFKFELEKNTGTDESIDFSSWIAGNSVDVTNLSKPESLIRTFPPQRRVHRTKRMKNRDV
jgi:hypothetical protein